MQSANHTRIQFTGMPTLVPHASDMTVAAMTDKTLAVLSLLSDIVVVIWQAKDFEEKVIAGHRVFMTAKRAISCLQTIVGQVMLANILHIRNKYNINV